MSGTGSEDNSGENNGCCDGNRMSSEALDRLLEAVAVQRRRLILYSLKDIEDDVISLDDLADKIAPNDPQFADPDRIRFVLHHRDLPKLAELGQLDYDSRQGTIRYHRNDAVEALLEHLKKVES